MDDQNHKTHKKHASEEQVKLLTGSHRTPALQALYGHLRQELHDYSQ